MTDGSREKERKTCPMHVINSNKLKLNYLSKYIKRRAKESLCVTLHSPQISNVNVLCLCVLITSKKNCKCKVSNM